MPDYTDSVETVSKVLSAVALTSAEVSYEFTKNASQRTIQMVCTTDGFYYAYTSGGPYLYIFPNCPFNLKLMKNPHTIYFMRGMNDSTLNLIVSN